MADEKVNVPGVSGEQRRASNYGTGTLAEIRNADLTFATGDAIGYVTPAGANPPVAFEDPLTPPWNCLGWLDTTGYTFKNTETTKDIGAAGTLSAIRTVITGGTKEFSFIALESMNPIVRALFDDVNLSQLIPPAARVDAGCGTTLGSATVTDTHITLADVGNTVQGTGIPDGAVIDSVVASTSFVMNMVASATGASVAVSVGGNTVSYVFPSRPSGNLWSLLFDTLDGDKRVRAFAPSALITTRGDDVYTQADVESLNMTATLYPEPIAIGSQPAVVGTLARYVDYGSTYNIVTPGFQ
jgi:hypothetical protein